MENDSVDTENGEARHLFRYRKGRSGESRCRRDVLSLNARLLQFLCLADMENCHPKVCNPVREGSKRQREPLLARSILRECCLMPPSFLSVELSWLFCPWLVSLDINSLCGTYMSGIKAELIGHW